MFNLDCNGYWRWILMYPNPILEFQLPPTKSLKKNTKGIPARTFLVQFSLVNYA